jgi:osmotically-inducible protein OsmY
MSGLVQGDWLTDRDIQQSVEDELTWTPELDATTIGVSVNDGVITLAGEVRSLAEKIAATKATLRVHGVSVLVDEITVPDGISGPRHDAAIGKAVLHALSWADYVPRDSVDAEVRHGSVTLTGTVDWDYQREAARRAVASLAGVRVIDNQIELSDREYS